MKTLIPKDEVGQNGYCPKCGLGALVKVGFTTNKIPKQRFRCLSCKFSTTNPKTEPPKALDMVPMKKVLTESKRYIITAAQNATPVHRATWDTLKVIAGYHTAEMVVIPGRYKNPTSQWTQVNEEHEWWDAEVMPYLCDGRINLNDRLVLLGDVKVQWAAQTPLNGMDSLTKDMCGIVGHGSRGLRSVATPQYKHPKIMLTTGSCTSVNYTDTKRGKIAEFNHCFGGLIVEIDGDTFYVRELNATEHGNIVDLDLEFTPKGVKKAPRALSLTMGDTHQRWILPGVVEATFTNSESIVNVVDPEYLIWHDLCDFHSRNHHHRDDWVTGFAKWKFGIESVKEEIDQAVAFVNEHTRETTQSVIVSSNHDRAVTRWLKEVDFRKDPINADFYLDCAKRAIGSARMTSGGVEFDDPFISYSKEIAKPNLRFLKIGESFILGGVEHGFHGDIGPNGSRGTTKNLSRIGVKVTKGHSHTAEIIDGCRSTGKSTGMLEYENGGPSSHSNADVLQYYNGKRTMIFIIDGKYCLPRPEWKE